jgi:hypothetical protein
MPWKECHVMDERLRCIARLLEGEKMALLCAEFGISRKTGILRRREIPAHRFGIEPKLGGDPLLRQALASQPKDFPDVNHGDLAIPPRLLAPGRDPGPETSIARSGERGKVLKLAPEGGKVLKNLTLEGGKVLKKSSGKVPTSENRQSPHRISARLASRVEFGNVHEQTCQTVPTGLVTRGAREVFMCKLSDRSD